MRPALVLLFACGCGSYIGTGPAPKVSTSRPMALAIDVTGDEHQMLDDAFDWLLRENGMVKRVRAGGDAHIAVESRIDRTVAILAGTNVVLHLRVHGEGVDESHDFAANGLSSGVPTELEKLATQGAVWALERSANASPAPTAAPAPTPEATPAVEAAPSPDEPSATTKKRRRRR